ncbi:MAG TPA: hypothetical protein V6C81_31620 [Planktothrix sp.]
MNNNNRSICFGIRVQFRRNTPAAAACYLPNPEKAQCYIDAQKWYLEAIAERDAKIKKRKKENECPGKSFSADPIPSMEEINAEYKKWKDECDEMPDSIPVTIIEPIQT